MAHRGLLFALVVGWAALVAAAAEDEETSWIGGHFPVFSRGIRIHHPPPHFPGLPPSLQRLLDDHPKKPPPFGAKHKFPFHPPGSPKMGQKAASVGETCKFSLDGEAYDLSRLTLPAGTPEYATEDPHHSIFKLNVCGNVAMGGPECLRKHGMICQYGKKNMMHLKHVIARWGTAPFPKWGYIDKNNKQAGVKLEFANGDKCDTHGKRTPRRASIYFPCDEKAGAIGNILAQETERCHFVFTIPSKYACPGAAGMSWGWIFITMVLFATCLYIVAGCVYNRYRFEAKGTEALPNREFWAEFPGYVSDGCAFSHAWLSRKMGGKNSSDMDDEEDDTAHEPDM